MATVSLFDSPLFGPAAGVAHKPTFEDPLEQAILASQQKDAAIVRRALVRAIDWLTTPEDHANDRMECAILACQRRDAIILRHLLGR